MTGDSRAKDIERYSFLYAFANDDIISQTELEFMKKLALEDGTIDEKESEVLCNILARVNQSKADPELVAQLKKFAEELGC